MNDMELGPNQSLQCLILQIILDVPLDVRSFSNYTPFYTPLRSITNLQNPIALPDLNFLDQPDN